MKDIRIATIKKSNINILEVKYTMKKDADTFQISLGQETRISSIKGKGKGKRTAANKSESNDRILNHNKTQNDLQKLYETRLPVSTKKYMDLKKLCDEEVIPKQYVQDYLQLPYTVKTDFLDDIQEDDDIVTTDEETKEQSKKAERPKYKKQNKEKTHTCVSHTKRQSNNKSNTSNLNLQPTAVDEKDKKEVKTVKVTLRKRIGKDKQIQGKKSSAQKWSKSFKERKLRLPMLNI